MTTPTTTQADPPRITCRDGCKRSVADMAEAQAKAWTLLPIQKRWRCPDCTRELNEANNTNNRTFRIGDVS